jgi:hypothetical protein
MEEDELLDQLPAHLRNKVLDHLVGEEKRPLAPYKKWRLRGGCLGLMLLLVWTPACLLVLIPLSIMIPFITIPLMFILIGAPTAYCIVAVLEELARRSAR